MTLYITPGIIIALLVSLSSGQVLINDFLVNPADQNINGLGRTAIAAASGGTFAVAWQDYNEYQNPVTEIPRIAVQLFSPAAQPVGLLNLFQGESRPLAIWTNDYLSGVDLDFHADGTLLVAVEHQGRFSIGSDDIGSAEVGVGAVSSAGQIIDLSGENGVIFWLIPTEISLAQNPRIAAAPTGEFFVSLDGPGYDTGFNAVLIQQLDENGNLVNDFFTPHFNDPGPNAHHGYSDIATNGGLLLAVWQDSRQDNNYDITAQFYNTTGALGSNLKINAGDPNGTLNIVPSVAMDPAGQSVVVWIDTRNGSQGDIYGQRLNAAGQLSGSNFRISTGQGDIWDRPEVAVRDDGSFMVVWTDSLPGVAGIAALRARARQFDANGNPLNEPFILPDYNGASGWVTVATDGDHYYCGWVDDRLNPGQINVFAKKMGNITTGIPSGKSPIIQSIQLYPAYPNPFNSGTIISYYLPVSQNVILKIFDITGRKVAILQNGRKNAGEHTVRFSAGEFASGIYFYQLQADDPSAGSGQSFIQTRKLLLVR